jgi:hypothetical protein
MRHSYPLEIHRYFNNLSTGIRAKIALCVSGISVAPTGLVRILPGQRQGTVLSSLSFKARGESLNDTKATVLSCGGIYIPQSKIPGDLKSWRQIVNLPGPELSAKIFGCPTPADPLSGIIKKEVLN